VGAKTAPVSARRCATGQHGFDALADVEPASADLHAGQDAAACPVFDGRDGACRSAATSRPVITSAAVRRSVGAAVGLPVGRRWMSSSDLMCGLDLARASRRFGRGSWVVARSGRMARGFGGLRAAQVRRELRGCSGAGGPLGRARGQSARVVGGRGEVGLRGRR
jgi:hypothetical protein